jgi:hypothetical protein
MIQKYRFTIDVEVEIDEQAKRLDESPNDDEHALKRKAHGRTLLSAVLRHPSLQQIRTSNLVDMMRDGAVCPGNFDHVGDPFDTIRKVALDLPGEAGAFYNEEHDALTPDHEGGADKWMGGYLSESMDEALDVIFGEVVKIKGSCKLVDNGLGSS